MKLGDEKHFMICNRCGKDVGECGNCWAKVPSQSMINVKEGHKSIAEIKEAIDKKDWQAARKHIGTFALALESLDQRLKEKMLK